MNQYRHITDEELKVLEGNGCISEDWDSILVRGDFEPSSIFRTRFEGDVRINGRCEISDTILEDTSLGCGGKISYLPGGIHHYEIGDNVTIINSGLIETCGASSFGNGTEVNVLSELGGRSVRIFDKLTSQWAYMSALYRYDKRFTDSLDRLAADYSDRRVSRCGTIGDNVKIINTQCVRNVKIGEGANLEGVSLLENGTIVSSCEAPVSLGPGVICRDFIILFGSTISDMAMVFNSFVGEGVTISRGFTCAESLVFANSHLENGESTALFAGPFTVSHHKSTLLIGSLFSFMNAGSNTNFSNHLYKMGPMHQAIFERGVKFASGSYIMLPAHIGAFSVVMGHHSSHPDTTFLPFSYIVNGTDASGSMVVPAVNLKSVGLHRDGKKWPQRDNRGVPEPADMVRSDVYSPYTANKILLGIRILNEIISTCTSEEDVVVYGNFKIKRSAAARGIVLYKRALKLYILERVVEILSSSEKGMRCGEIGTGEWVDISGMLAPRSEILRVMDEVKSGKISSVEEFRQNMALIHNNFDQYERNWILSICRKMGKPDFSMILTKDLSLLRSELSEVRSDYLDSMMQDADKEFSRDMVVGFGVDTFGDMEQKESDVTNVRGTLSDFLDRGLI